MKPISSLQNRRVKEAIQLRARSAREKQGRFLVDGLMEIGHAIAGDFEMEELFICPPLLSADGETLLQAASGVPSIWEVTRPVWDKLTFGNRSSGILAIAQAPNRSLDELAHQSPDFVVVLDRLEKPGNVGAIIRTADGAGVDAVLLADAVSDTWNPNTIRASLGTVFRKPVVTQQAHTIREWLEEREFSIFVAHLGATQEWSQVRWDGRVAVVLGSEATGVGPAWNDPRLTRVRIPMLGCADSLNVSASAAVLLYEALRQRRGR